MKKIFVMCLLFGFLAPGLVIAQETHQGDINIGPRVVLGAVYGASMGFAAHGEYALKDDFIDLGEDVATWIGLGGSIAYSQYSQEVLFFTSGEKFTYRNVVILGSVFFHANVFKNPKLDTYLLFSVGTNTGSVKYSGTAGNISTPTVGAFTAGGGVGARYYFSPKAAVVAEAGVGIGALRLGVDFKL